MRWILIRHGQSAWNVGKTDDYDSDITERGNYQIQEVALHLKEIMEWESDEQPTYTMFVSPLQRTLKTALVIQKRFNIKTIVDHRISETPDNFNFPKVAPLPNRSSSYPTYDWSRYPSEGINIHQVTQEQYHENLKSFAKDISDYAIVISHMTTIIDLTSILVKKDLKHEIPNCSITLIEDGQLVFIGKR